VAVNWLNKEMKSRKDGRIEITARNQEMAEQKFYGFTKTRWIETKKRYRSSSDDSIILLLKFEVLSYLDWMNPIDGIIK